MATTTAVCTSYKVGLMSAGFNHTTTTGNIFAIALIKVSPTGTYGAASTNYSNITGNSDEVANGTGYTTGGFIWTAAQNITAAATSGIVVSTSWNTNPSWTAASFSTTAGMIYGGTSTPASGSVATYDFGGTQTVTAGTLTLVLPANSGTTAILSIS